MQSALIFIIESLVALFLIVLLLRFWLPLIRADFRNPIAQGILRITSPLIIPLRRIIPPIGRIDSATVLTTFVIQFLLVLLVHSILNLATDIGTVTTVTILELVLLNLKLFMVAIFIFVILSWVAPTTHNPATVLVGSLVAPLLQPFSRILPKPGGIDISPIIVIILLQATILLVQEIGADLLA